MQANRSNKNSTRGGLRFGVLNKPSHNHQLNQTPESVAL